jgi:DNA invertase Pin-like site-specific DNA recombinase
MIIPPRLRTALYARVACGCQPRDALCQRGTDDACLMAEQLCFLDDGQSSAPLQWPALQRLHDPVAAGGVDRLSVYSPDRLSRNCARQAGLVEPLRRTDVGAIFLKK